MASKTPYKQRRHRCGNLANIDDILGEMRRVYRAVRNRDLELDQAKCYTYILNYMASMIKTGDLESRLDELEEHLAKGNNITSLPIAREVKNESKKQA